MYKKTKASIATTIYNNFLIQMLFSYREKLDSQMAYKITVLYKL